MTLLRPPFVFLFLVLSLGAARAGTTPKVDVTQEGDGYRIRIEAVLAARPRDVWAVLTDCALAHTFVPHLESCRILEKDPAGRWDVRENIANPPFLPRMRSVVRSEYEPPRGFKYKLVSGDMRKSEGAWSLTPHEGGAYVVYFALIEPNLTAPGFLVTRVIGADFPEMFRKLDELSRARAAKP